MKSLVSILSLGLLLIRSHVSAAPQGSPSSDTSELAAPVSTDGISENFNETAFAAFEVEDPSLSAGQPSLRKMKRKYQRYIVNTVRKRPRSHSCTLKNLSIRKEWGSMSKKQRIAYTDAVKCLYSKKPPVSNPSNVPGARNRLDDFVAAHIQQGQNIHFDGYLFAWHRHFVHIYEKTLREECGYKGPTPYWDWTLNPDDPRKSPVFDGSATSMSGNGQSIPHGGTYVTAFGLNVTLPPGTGGGCVKDGPFANLQVNLGVNPTVLPPAPVDLTANLSSVGVYASADRSDVLGDNPSDNSSARAFRVTSNDLPPAVRDALQYNPRCLTRDINLFWANQVRTKDVEFLLSCGNVDCLEKRSDGWEIDRTKPQPLLHAAGHFSVGGLQNDPFASPGDPVFYLHHAAFDRVYSIWQGQDGQTRTYQVGGTRTPFNIPPSDPVTLDDNIDFGAIASSVKMRDVMSTIDGPYCYMYD